MGKVSLLDGAVAAAFERLASAMGAEDWNGAVAAQNGMAALTPRVFNVLPGHNWDNAYCVLRFEPDQEHAAALAQLFCS